MTHNGLFRPVPYLTAVSTDKATASQQPPQAQLHRYHGSFRASSCLPVFSRPNCCPQAHSFASRTCSPNKLLPASRPARQAQILPHTNLVRPSSCLTVACRGPGPAPNRLLSVPELPQHLQAQNFLKWASPGLPQVGLSRLSSSSRLHLQAHLLRHNNLFQLSSCPAPGSLYRPKAFSHHVL
nr:LOW QUALITY PROTEIN: uncharacterized protein LOC103227350 [Chlorocebus sabaeus]